MDGNRGGTVAFKLLSIGLWGNSLLLAVLLATAQRIFAFTRDAFLLFVLSSLLSVVSGFWMWSSLSHHGTSTAKTIPILLTSFGLALLGVSVLREAALQFDPQVRLFAVGFLQLGFGIAAFLAAVWAWPTAEGRAAVQLEESPKRKPRFSVASVAAALFAIATVGALVFALSRIDEGDRACVGGPEGSGVSFNFHLRADQGQGPFLVRVCADQTCRSKRFKVSSQTDPVYPYWMHVPLANIDSEKYVHASLVIEDSEGRSLYGSETQVQLKENPADPGCGSPRTYGRFLDATKEDGLQPWDVAEADSPPPLPWSQP